jgi:hypothetical protein
LALVECRAGLLREGEHGAGMSGGFWESVLVGGIVRGEQMRVGSEGTAPISA